MANGSEIDQLAPELRESLMEVTGRFSRPNRHQIRARNKEIGRSRRQKVLQSDRQARSETGIREARKQASLTPPLLENLTQPSRGLLQKSQKCYVCKSEYQELHFFYDSMCARCADFNFKKRSQSASLQGQVALITGARVKIGYQAALMMLRAGARVIVTTRFPVDAASRFSRETDFARWSSRLEVFGLDHRA